MPTGATTNYNKAEMLVLVTSLTGQKAAYDTLVSDLQTNVFNIQNFWVEGDSEAQAVYDRLKAQFLEFKKKLDQGSELMEEFKREVSNQEERYAAAESETLSAINRG